MADDNIAGLAGSVGAHDALDRDDLPDKGVLDLVGVEGDVGLVVVGVRLEEVLLPARGSVGYSTVRPTDAVEEGQHCRVKSKRVVE